MLIQVELLLIVCRKEVLFKGMSEFDIHDGGQSGPGSNQGS
jgi:hypothetical protein